MARGRLRRRAVRLGAVGLGVVGLVAAVGSWWLSTPAGSAWLTRQVVAQVRSRQVEGDFTVGAVHANLFRGIEIDDVSLTDGTGRTVIGARRVRLRYDLLPLLGKRAQIDEVFLQDAVVDLTADERGLLDIQRMFGQTEPAPDTDEPWAGLPIDVDIDKIVILGAHVRYRMPGVDVRATGVTAAGEMHGSDTRIAFEKLDLGGVLLTPIPTPLRLEGDVAYTGDGVEAAGAVLTMPPSRLRIDGALTDLSAGGRWDLRVGADPLDLDHLDRLLGGVGLHGRVQGQLAAVGPKDAVRVTGTLDGVAGTRGGLDVDVTVDTDDDRVPWTGAITARALHVEDLYPGVGREIALDGKLTARGGGTTWPDDVTIDARWEGGPLAVDPVEFTSLSTDLKLDRGVLSFTDVRTDGPLGPVAANGSLDLVSGDLLVTAGGRLVLDGLASLGVDDLGGQGPVLVKLEGNVLADALPLRATGTAVMAPFRYGADVRFDRMTARFTWNLRDQDQAVDANVVADSGVVYGTRLARAAVPDLHVALPASGAIRVTGNARADQVLMPDVFATDWAEAPFTVAVVGEQTRVEAAARLGPHALLDWYGNDGAIGIVLDGDRLGFDVDLRSGLENPRPFVVTRGEMDLATQAIALESLLLSPTPRQVWRGGAQRLRLVEGGIADAELAIASELGALEVRGTIATAGDLGGTVAVEGFHLDAVAELFPAQASGLAGVVDATVTAAGTAEAPALDVAIDARGVWMEGMARWLDAKGTASVRPDAAVLDLDVGSAGTALASVDGRVPLRFSLADPQLDPKGTVDASIAIAPGTFERFEWLVEDLDLPAGRVSAVVKASGPLEDPDFDLAGVAEVDVPGWAERGRVEFATRRDGDAMTWWADGREGFAARALFDGGGKTRIGDVIAWALGSGPEPDFDDWTMFLDEMTAKIALLGTPVSSLMAMSGASVDATGELVGGFVVRGSPVTPTISGAINWIDATVADVPIEGAYFDLVAVDGGYTTNLSLAFAGEREEDRGSLELTGKVPIVVNLREEQATWQKGELALEIGGAGVPLALASIGDPDIRDAKGLVKIEGGIRGDVFDPQYDLAVHLDGGGFVYEAYDVRWKDVRFECSATRQRAACPRISAASEPLQDVGLSQFGRALGGNSNRSELLATARVDFDGWTPTEVGAQLRLADTYLSYTYDTILRLSTREPIVISGTWPALHVRGLMEVDAGRFTFDAAAFTEAAPFEVDPRITIHRGEQTRIAGPIDEEPPFYADFDVEVGVDLNRNVEIRAALPFVQDYGSLGAAASTAEVVARLGGAGGARGKDYEPLAIAIEDGEVRLLHEVEIVEGQVSLLSGVFDIRGGRVVFLGDPANPILDLDARMTVSGGTIEMLVSGPAEDPDISLRSDDYPDQTEIFTILLTGKSPEELTSGEGAGSLSAVSGLLLNQVLGGIQTHSVTVDPDGTVRVSVPFSSDVHGSAAFDTSPTSYENGTAVEIEWTPLPFIVVEGTWGDEHSFADVYYEVQF